MFVLSRRAAIFGLAASLSACGSRSQGADERIRSDANVLPLHPNETPELRRLINKYADLYEVPRPLVHRVVIRESTHNPAARNGPYYGLMQILPATARTMGYRGDAKGLLDAENNLKYAVKYLRGAWLLADGSFDEAVKWYSRGYYFEAKRRGLLQETDLRT
ncbi:MAG: soluble lytic murein transglycosylase-like protein [Pseudorhodobacter sp.]|jgi:soluble lytic murein transglycosylase-like protein